MGIFFKNLQSKILAKNHSGTAMFANARLSDGSSICGHGLLSVAFTASRLAELGKFAEI